MKTQLAAVLFILTVTSAQASSPNFTRKWKCEGITEFDNPVVVQIEIRVGSASASVVVLDQFGNLELTSTFSNVDGVWDGHKTGLMTAKGLSIKYEDHFGILRNVIVTSNIRAKTPYIEALKFEVCNPS
jgi:hypothetical protein